MTDLPALKSDLRKANIDVQAARRIEGAARGFGYGSYATMRLALQDGIQVVEPDDAVFADYIGFTADEYGPRTLSRALARVAVRSVMEREPQLTERGYDTVWPRFSDERKMTLDERKAAFAKRREDTLHDNSMDEFELAWIYLSMQQRRKTINMDFGSYGLKHRAENLSRKQGQYTHLGDYVSNGMFIIAALACGFEAKQIDYGPNACFNISSKTIRATAGHPIMTRRDQGRLFAMAMASA
ncbi:hypothetical protein [Sphingomonas canadensis]|uniref:hypothetical protein n=1 Tax=Sphingomonas canadensis TaxID=1219257 RepID=UPI002231BDC9|nr:hypothetical protein [Sphingomonas canadensis]